VGRKGRPVRRADNLTVISEPIAWKTWEPRRLTTLWATTACYRDSLTFFINCVLTVLRRKTSILEIRALL
jgi:hypothetical protein